MTTYITKRGGTAPQTLSDVRNQVWFNLRKNRLSLFDELAPADIVYLFFDYGADSVLWKTRLITVTQFTYSSVEELAMRFTEHNAQLNRTDPYVHSHALRRYCLLFRVEALECFDQSRPRDFHFDQGRSAWKRLEASDAQLWGLPLR